MKKLLFQALLLCFFIACSNQLFSQEVVATAGGHSVGSTLQVSWTVGEPVTETETNGQYILTQGMHQGNLVVTVARELEDIAWNISAYPNPVSSYLNLDIDAPQLKNFSFVLYSIDGQLLHQGEVLEHSTTIPMDTYSHSSYLLRVLSDKTEVKVFRIVKNQ